MSKAVEKSKRCTHRQTHMNTMEEGKPKLKQTKSMAKGKFVQRYSLVQTDQKNSSVVLENNKN